ncbi:MAG: family 10 glycosylhydrolase [Planctomycetes bacterium]|nr:family 10 glycosylhydrolase [Planctomycetota bacterium]
MRRLLASLPLFALLAFTGCGSLYAPTSEEVPAPPREFRAAWIATVHNIDWPSKPGLPVAEQQRELLVLLDRAASLGLNAVVFQVRPTCDALYASEIEPWSRYLTGRSGQAPEPFYDPLEFAVREAHLRGLELHAWFNPYRARPGDDEPPVVPQHVSHPDSPLYSAIRPYGKLLLLDPGLPEVQAYSTRVIVDVAQRYDVDGIHMDDYFYPYPLERPDESVVPFPDAETFARYGGGKSRSEWRRENVNGFVKNLTQAIHAVEPWLKVGIAPFGIWRPKHPGSVRGMDAYEAISTDTRRWLYEGWIDYLSPQLYWGTEFPEQRFSHLIRWWEDQNPTGRHLWPGIATRWIESKRDPTRDAQEILDQIGWIRSTVPVVRPGHIHWNLGALVEDRGGIVAALGGDSYREAALVPASPWLAGEAPAALEDVDLEAEGEGLVIRWSADSKTRWVALQVRDAASKPWRLVGVRRAGGAWTLPDRPAALALRPVGSSGLLGPARVLARSE